MPSRLGARAPRVKNPRAGLHAMQVLLKDEPRLESSLGQFGGLISQRFEWKSKGEAWGPSMELGARERASVGAFGLFLV